MVQETITGSTQIQIEQYSKLLQAYNTNAETTLFKQLVDLVIKRKGILKISELENLSGYTSRYINKIFNQELGLSAKQICKTVKFHFLLEDLSKGKTLSFTNLASEYNFYDQSHFIHEFKEFTGKTPREYTNKAANL